MATTTNYGWTTPDDTALVKDGASAIRTLGSSVDTTTKNLNPQTTLGDIAYRSSSSNVNTRLGIGTTGQILSVSGGVPVWSSPSASGFVGCFLYQSGGGAVSVSNNTATILLFDSEEFDTDTFHSTASNTGRITIPSGKAGKYLFVGYGNFAYQANDGVKALKLFKNGSAVRHLGSHLTTGMGIEIQFGGAAIIDAAVADYFELSIYQNAGTTYNTGTGITQTSFAAYYLGA